MTTQIGTATGFLDFVDILDGFLTDAGHAWGLVDNADGNGTLSDIAGGVSSVNETITITMVSAVDFQVQGSVSGNLGYGVVGSPFVDAAVEFTITNGSQPFIAGDYWTLSTSPAWTQKRRNMLVELSGDSGSDGVSSFHKLTDGILRNAASDAWITTAPPPMEMIFEHETAFSALEYAISINNAGNEPTEWTLDYWTGAAWVALDTRTGVTWVPSHVGNWQVFTIASPLSAARYRWRVTARNGDRINVGQFSIRSAVGGINRLEGAVIWEAPGDDGVTSFIAGVKPLSRADRDYHTLELFTMDAYSAGAELIDQANLTRNTYLPLWDDPMDYWLVARGSYCIGVVKVGSLYESFIFGTINPYYPPNEWPLPLVLGGSLARGGIGATYNGPVDSAELRFSVTDRTHQAWPTAGFGSALNSASQCTQTNQERAQLRIRMFDGNYRGAFSNADGSYDAEFPVDVSAPLPMATLLPYYRGFGATGRSLDDEPLLWPIIIGTRDDVLGELPGVRAVSGDGVSAETIITQEGYEWLVVSNVFRTDFIDFFAVRLD